MKKSKSYIYASVYRILSIMLCICMTNGVFNYNRLCWVRAEEKEKAREYELDENKLYAQSAVLMDADSGRILYAKNGQEQRPMASTTKIMTLIVTLENANLEELVTVSEYAASMPDVQLHMKKGEQYVLKDLLYSLMLESHNDSAVAIAEYVGGGAKEVTDRSKEESKEAVARFCEMMNQKARDIGCFHTCFLTPNGLDATITVKEKQSGESVEKIHSTTAEDLAKIMSYCVRKSAQRDLFIEITRTPSYRFSNKVQQEDGSWVNGSRSFSCQNHNAFLNMMEGAESGKTGYTSLAGYCYVGYVQDGGRQYTVALLACGWPNHKGYKWQDMKKLVQFGTDQFQIHNLEEAVVDAKTFAPIIVEEGKTEQIGQEAYVSVLEEKKYMAGNGVETLLLRENEKIITQVEKKEGMKAPVKKGEIMGTITYKVGSEVWRCVNLVAGEDVEKIDYVWCMEKIVEKFVL